MGEIRKINYKSDFEAMLSVGQLLADGGTEEFLGHKWEIKFYTTYKPSTFAIENVVAGDRRGVNWEYASEVDRIRVYFDKHNLGCGELSAEVHVHFDDARYTVDGRKDIVNVYKIEDIQLIDGESTEMGAVDIDILSSYIIADATLQVIDDAIERATNATNSATNAANDTIAAVRAAREAIEDAGSAAAEAREAAGGANTATTNATRATTAAVAATERANAAAENVELMVEDRLASESNDGLMSKEDKAKMDMYSVKDLMYTMYAYEEYKKRIEKGEFVRCFMGDSNLVLFPTVDMKGAIGLSQMFRGCPNLKYIDVSRWDTSKVVTLERIFTSCNQLLKGQPLNVENWDVSNVTDMTDAFGHYNWFTLDMSRWNTSKVKNMSEMFSYAFGNITGFEGWDVSSLEDTGSMFAWRNMETVWDLSRWHCPKLRNAPEMFYRDVNVTEIDISNFGSTAYSNIKNMFGLCQKLETLRLGNFNTENIVSTDGFEGMFTQCYKLKNIIGQWVNIKTNLSFSDSKELTRESVLMIINGLHDFSAEETGQTHTLALHATAKTLLTAQDIAQATVKGWTII